MTDADGHPSVPTEPDGAARVTERLRDLPRDIAMPRDVSIRIAAAIEAEAQSARERGTLDLPAAARRSGPDEPRGWFRRRAPVLLAGAAGIGVLTFGFYLVGTGGNGEDNSLATGADDSAVEQEEAAPEDGAGSAPTLTGPYAEHDTADGDVDAFAEPDAALSALVTAIAATGTEAEPGCGSVFADQIGAEILGSQAVDDGILVVTTTEGTATVEGWTLAACSATEPIPDVDPVVVPRPTP